MSHPTKPSKEDFDAVHDFLQGIKELIEEDATPIRAMNWIQLKWRRVESIWSRVLWAGLQMVEELEKRNKNPERDIDAEEDARGGFGPCG